MTGGPSEKAIRAALDVRDNDGGWHDAVEAAHDTSLGLDRSVCLRDVVEFLLPDEPHDHDHLDRKYAESVAREFGGGS